MKPEAVLAVLFLGLVITLSPRTAAAQEFGVLAGVTSSTLEFEDDSGLTITRRTGFQAGVYVVPAPASVAGVELEALVAQRGAALEFLGEDLTIKTTYLDVPVLVRLGTPSDATARGFVIVGPSFNVKLSERFDPDDPSTQDEIKSFETAIVAGGGVMVGNLRIDARYVKGLTDIAVEEGDDANVKSQSFGVNVGIRF